MNKVPPNAPTAYRQLAHLMDQYALWRKNTVSEALATLLEAMEENERLFQSLSVEAQDALIELQEAGERAVSVVNLEKEGFQKVLELLGEQGFRFDPDLGWLMKEADGEGTGDGNPDDEDGQCQEGAGAVRNDTLGGPGKIPSDGPGCDAPGDGATVGVPEGDGDQPGNPGGA